ncbi:MAG TPA: TIGR04255 family protein [Candidatus Angelobacter sp.]|nr:TIGR04255 family protein [Candidatus Angelobacter sp.]
MRKYKRPPIVERAFSVGVQIDEELFHRRIEEWKDLLQKSFPEMETITEWQIKVTQKDGMPSFDQNHQRMSLKHRFWKGGQSNRDKGIQVWRDRVAFNLVGGPANPRHYEELEEFSHDWLPRWADHFEVKTLRGITLEYVNFISFQTVPKFASENKIDLKNILNFFSNLPGPGKTLIPPYNFEINLGITETPPMRFSAHLQNIESQPGSTLALRLDFKATTEGLGRKISLDEVKNELRLAHDLILQEFEAYFTVQARDSFGPYDSGT